MGGLDGFHSCTSIGGGVYRSVMNIWKKKSSKGGTELNGRRKYLWYIEKRYDLTRKCMILRENVWFRKLIWFYEKKYDLTKIDMILRENVLFSEKIDMIYRENWYHITRKYLILRQKCMILRELIWFYLFHKQITF